MNVYRDSNGAFYQPGNLVTASPDGTPIDPPTQQIVNYRDAAVYTSRTMSISDMQAAISSGAWVIDPIVDDVGALVLVDGALVDPS